jgi:hypothetical protein
MSVVVAAVLMASSMAGAEEPGGSRRPEGTAVGVGFGYLLPTAIDNPNTTSVRFRMSSGLMLEPVVVLNFAGDSTTGVVDTSDGAQDFAVGALVHYLLGDSDAVDLSLIGTALVGLSRDNPDGDDNNQSDIDFGLGWGLGVTWWASHHWSLSMDATNPFFSFSKSTQEQVGDDTSQSAWNFGLNFAPTVRMMLHLFW